MTSSLMQTLGRVSLFIIYFWFGLLKLIGYSPAGSLVHALYDRTPIISLIPFTQFYIMFALFEMLIGILFLSRKYGNIALLLFLVHIFMTTLPLFVLPGITWQKFLIPTLEGQYIIKNIALVTVALSLKRSHR
jgi:uncharacterized membrane protein YkgB